MMAITVRDRKLGKGEISFYLDINTGTDRWTETLKGVRITEITPAKERKAIREALELFRSQRELELAFKDRGIKTQKRDHEDFINYCKTLSLKRGSKTKEGWNSLLAHLENYEKGKIRFKDLDSKWIERFLDFLKSEKLSPNTIVTYYQKIKAALNQAVKDEIIDRSPALKVKSPSKVEVMKNVLTPAEIDEIQKTEFFNDEVKRAFLFSTQTGLRFIDIKNLKWDDIESYKEGRKTCTRVKLRQQKTTTVNYLPLTESAVKLIGKQKNGNEKVFKLSDSTSSINRTFKKLLKKTKIKKKITLHNARHTFATSLISSGADLYTTQKLLGHKDIKSTQVYAKVIDQVRIDAVNRLPAINFQSKNSSKK